jgi:hypothetical protein
MYRLRSSVLLSGFIVLAGAAQAVGQTLCKPALGIKEARLSEMHLSQRIWTAHIAVDASRCTATSGRFDIHFTRLKEIGPDLPFTEQFTWHEGEFDVTSEFWADEAVLDYTIAYIAPCGCRKLPPWTDGPTLFAFRRFAVRQSSVSRSVQSPTAASPMNCGCRSFGSCK